MKRILLLLVLLVSVLPFLAKSQNPDTVCYHSTLATYQVANTPGNTYTWTVSSPGIITGGQGTNQITVNWSSASPGLITGAVSVYATSAAGCPSPPVDLNVFVLNIVPTVSPLDLCINAGCTTLSGSPLGGTWSGVGVNGNQFCPSVAGVGNTNITYTYSLAGCTFTATGSATVNPLPVITPIIHN